MSNFCKQVKPETYVDNDRKYLCKMFRTAHMSVKPFAIAGNNDIIINMETGISTASFFPRLYTEDALARIAELGAKVSEVFFASRCEYTRDFGNVLLSRLAHAEDMRVHSVHALTNQFEPELYSLNDRAYGDAVSTFESVCKVAEQIGARNYTFHGATMLKKAVKYSFNYDLISERVNILCDLAEKYGVTLCYENVHWAYFCNPGFFNEIKDRCPKLGATLDVKQAMQSEISWKEYLASMKGRLKTVHLCDYDDNGNLCLPGRGTFDFVSLYCALAEAGFDGPCLMEVYTKSYKDESELKRAFEFLKECEIKALTR